MFSFQFYLMCSLLLLMHILIQELSLFGRLWTAVILCSALCFKAYLVRIWYVIIYCTNIKKNGTYSTKILLLYYSTKILLDFLLETLVWMIYQMFHEFSCILVCYLKNIWCPGFFYRLVFYLKYFSGRLDRSLTGFLKDYKQTTN